MNYQPEPTQGLLTLLHDQHAEGACPASPNSLSINSPPQIIFFLVKWSVKNRNLTNSVYSVAVNTKATAKALIICYRGT